MEVHLHAIFLEQGRVILYQKIYLQIYLNYLVQLTLSKLKNPCCLIHFLSLFATLQNWTMYPDVLPSSYPEVGDSNFTGTL